MWTPSRNISEMVLEYELISLVDGWVDASVMAADSNRGMFDGSTLALCFFSPDYDPSMKFPTSTPLSFSSLSGSAPTEPDRLACIDMSEEVH